jgi:hypothetical protein
VRDDDSRCASDDDVDDTDDDAATSGTVSELSLLRAVVVDVDDAIEADGWCGKIVTGSPVSSLSSSSSSSPLALLLMLLSASANLNRFSVDTNACKPLSSSRVCCARSRLVIMRMRAGAVDDINCSCAACEKVFGFGVLKLRFGCEFAPAVVATRGRRGLCVTGIGLDGMFVDDDDAIGSPAETDRVRFARRIQFAAKHATPSNIKSQTHHKAYNDSTAQQINGHLFKITGGRARENRAE